MEHTTYQAWTGFAVTFTFDDDGNQLTAHVDGPDEGDPFPRIGPTVWAVGPDHPGGKWVYDDEATGDSEDLSIAVTDYAAKAAADYRRRSETAALWAEIQDLLDAWEAFSHQCARDERTDTGRVWEIMEPVLDRHRPGHSDPEKCP